MTVGFNYKTPFWYFLYLFCCKKFPDDEDDVRNRTKYFSHHNFIDQVPEKSKEKPGKEDEKFTEIFIIPLNNGDIYSTDVINSTVIFRSVDLEAVATIDVDKSIPISVNIICETEDDRLKFPVDYSDDESSSISDVNSVHFHEDYLRVDSTLSVTIPITQTVELKEEMCAENEMVTSQIEPLDLQTAAMEIVNNILLHVAEIIEFQSKSFNTPQDSVELPATPEKVQYVMELNPDDLWEFTDIILEEPMEIIDTLISLPDVVEKDCVRVEENYEILTNNDKQILSEKINWLIPFESYYLDTHINAAILHFFLMQQQVSQNTIEDSLILASESLPDMYTSIGPIVTESEVGEALCDPLKQHSFIDKRVIFHLIREKFSEIFSMDRRLPQPPWTQSSVMIKRKNYTLWRGNRPPQSYDLVSKIVREYVCQILNQKNIFLGDIPASSLGHSSYSNITKWCMDRQKDNVDRILINEWRKEEDQWISFDEAEERILILMAEDIFDNLITDAISWMRSVNSLN